MDGIPVALAVWRLLLRRSSRMRLLSALVVTVLFGCAREKAAPAPAPAPAQAAAVVAAERPSGEGVRGKVLETFEAPGYTYLRLNTATGEQWAAIPTTSVAVG